MFHRWANSPSVEIMAGERVYKLIHSFQVETETYLPVINCKETAILEYSLSQAACVFFYIYINTRRNQLRNLQVHGSYLNAPIAKCNFFPCYPRISSSKIKKSLQTAINNQFTKDRTHIKKQ